MFTAYLKWWDNHVWVAALILGAWIAYAWLPAIRKLMEKRK